MLLHPDYKGYDQLDKDEYVELGPGEVPNSDDELVTSKTCPGGAGRCGGWIEDGDEPDVNEAPVPQLGGDKAAALSSWSVAR